MQKQRPVNLDLLSIRFPLPAIVSILHRISGVILFLLIPMLLLILADSLASPVSFLNLQYLFASPILKLIVWVILSALIYHLTAGLRHLLMDAGVGETKSGGRIGAILVLAISVLLILLAGVWIW